MIISNRILIFVVAAVFSSVFATAQTLTQTIRGIVTDADSKTPLPGAGVKLVNTDTVIAGTCDANGKFRLEKVPVGRRSIQVSFVGYQNTVINNIIVTSGKEIVLNIELVEQLTYITDEVTITGNSDKTKTNNDLITNSGRSFNKEETERYAGSRGDPSKMVANFAGVASGNDARNDIIVRGNSPLGVLWRLEGVDIPNPNHFSTQGATGGPLSILNNNLLGGSDFLTGAFPAEYGNKYAAVFDLKLRNGNNEKFEYLGQIGFNGAEAGIEGPLMKKNGGSFLLNYRYSTFWLFDVLGIDFGVSGIPQYSDFCYKFNLPTKNAGVFSMWAIGGKSSISLLDSKKEADDWSLIGQGQDIRFGSRMGATGLSHVYFFNDKVSGKLSLSVSGSKFEVLLDSLSVNKEPYRIYDNTSIDASTIASYTVTYKINSHHLIKGGVNYNHMFFNYHARNWSNKYQLYVDQLNENDNAGLVQSYVHWQYRITDNFTLNSGLHYQQFLLNNSKAIEPRAGLRYTFAKKHSLSAAFGLHNQSQPLVYYFFKRYNPVTNETINNTRNLDFTKSLHYVIGYDFNFAKDFRLKLETYYQDIYNVPIHQYERSSFSLVNIGNDLDGIPLVDSLVNKGVAYNYGGEFTLEKFFSKGYYFLTTLSVYESKYKPSDGVWRNTSFSGGYVFNTLLGYEIALGKKNKFLSFDTKFTMAGGNRYTPLDVAASVQANQAVYVDSLAFSAKFKDYQRLDFKVSFRMNGKKCTQSLFVNIENILNRKNILQQVWDQNKQAVKQEYQLGLFPYAGYRIEF
jgi:hypothetical protein